MNILHLQISGNPGGIVTLCRTIANNSKNINHMYFLLQGGTVAEAMQKEGIPVYVANSDRYAWRKSIKRLVNYIEKNNIKVLVNHSNSPIACAHVLEVKRKCKNIKVIMYLHGAAEDMFPNNYKAVFYKMYIKKMAKEADKIIAISNFVKQSCIDVFNINEKKIQVIYNGTDCKKFENKVRKEKKESKTEIIYVGRVFKKKGVYLLIEAMKLIPQDIKLHLTIVGNGPDQNILEDRCKELGIENRVSFLGLRMDIPDILKKADFFVHPAIWNEGFGITLIEAMASGLPCIAFDKGAISEIIDDEKNGFLISEISAKELANKILIANKIITEEIYSTMSKCAIETAHRFDIKDMVETLEKLYE